MVAIPSIRLGVLFRTAPRELVQQTAAAQPELPRHPALPDMLLVRYRMTLRAGERADFGESPYEVTVLSGSGRVTCGERTRLLASGEGIATPDLNGAVTICAGGDEPLVVCVVLDGVSADHIRLKERFHSHMAARLGVLDAEASGK